LEIPRIVISSNSSDSGKTLATIGLLWLLRKKGYKAQPFKVGPDYIDPGYHTVASGAASRNLDSWIMEETTIKSSFTKASAGSDCAVIEGVRGLYEGASPLEETGSTAHIAKMLKAPVILVLDCMSITRSAAAYILGLKAFDKDVNIAGVILNKVSDKRHEEKLKSAILHYTKTPVLGVIYRSPSFNLQKRHLGLLTVQENIDALKIIESIGLSLQESLNLESILSIMNTAPPIEAPEEERLFYSEVCDVKIGVFMDPAFTFYYPENIEAMNRYGAEVRKINSLSDAEIGDDVSGIVIGGGYPEVFAQMLEANSSLRKDIKKRSNDGMPIIGECGGLMYLCNSIEFANSKKKMSGIFEGEIVIRDKPQALSYVLLESKAANPVGDQGDMLKGHEFHYSEIQGLKETNFVFKVLRGRGICNSMDGLLFNSTLGMYTHLHYLAYPKTANKFVASCRSYMRR